MSGLLRGGAPLPVINILGGVRAQTSLNATPVPLVFGRTRVAPNLIWFGDFIARQIQGKGGTGGKGAIFGAGGKGQANYDYGAAVVMALCQGPITGVGAVWDTQGTLPVNDTTEAYTVGPPYTYEALQQNTYIQDLGVTKAVTFSVPANDFGSPFGPVTIVGTQQVPLVYTASSSPGPGQYNQHSDGFYIFNPADAGAVLAINYSFGPPNVVGSDPIASLNLVFADGAQSQTAWGYLLSKHPAQALGYTLLAYAASELLDLGSSGALPNLNFEVFGLLPFAANAAGDALPRDVLYALMTDPLFGMGFETTEIGDTSQYAAYCAANGLLVSPAYTTVRTGTDVFKEMLDATNAEIVQSGGLLNFVPYGDTTAVGNGQTYQPQTQPVYDLTDDDLIRKDESRSAVLVERASIKDAFNAVRIEYTDRTANYNTQVLEAQDLGAIDDYGYRPETSRQYPFLTTAAAAQVAAQTALVRLVYIRNQYKFTLRQTRVLLDPMDLVTLPPSPELGPRFPVRLTAVQENDDKTLDCEAEEFPFGCSGPTLYPAQTGLPTSPAAAADPGDTAPPILFEAVPRLRGSDPQQELWIAVSGAGANWGGCRIWLSVDGGATYSAVGVKQGRSSMGETSSSGPWPTGSDPETVNDLTVLLDNSTDTLATVSTSVENAFGSLCYVGNGSGTPGYELMSYAVAQLISAGVYTLKATGAGNFLRRGVFGTPITAHPAGSPFAYIGDGIFVLELDVTLAGVPLMFKFTSFNLYNASEQSLANVTAYSFTPTGLNPGLQGIGYTIAPAMPVTQDVTTLTTVDVAPFKISSTSGLASYLGPQGAALTPFTGLSDTSLYYVYVFDPAFRGENAALSIVCPYSIATTPNHAGDPGWFFVGSIQMAPGGGGGTPGGGGGGQDPGGGGGTPPLAT